MIICNQCGHSMVNDMRFCTECGAPIPVFNEPAPPPPPISRYVSPQADTIASTTQQQGAYAPPPPATPDAQLQRKTNPFLWLLIPLGVLVVAVAAIIGLQSSGPSEETNTNYATSYNGGYASPNKNTSVSNASVSSTPASNTRVSSTPVSNTSVSNTFTSNTRVSSTPYPAGRTAVCMFTPVNVRYEPNLTATIITNISAGQRVLVLSESTNYDTVYVRSLKREVTANWYQIEVENTSIRGWVFSGFLK